MSTEDECEDPCILALRRATDAYDGMTGLARALGVGRSAVSNWFLRSRVPAEQAARIARLPGCGVGAHELRPDLFAPPPPTQGVASDRRSGVPDRRRRLPEPGV